MKNIKNLGKRSFALFLALILCMSVINLSAFAAEGVMYCGKEEHTHTSDCYTLTCDREESEGHTHGDDCYDWSREETPGCGEEESEGHAHTDDCYAWTTGEIACDQEESEDHTHTEACYEQVKGDLTCTVEESAGHTHTDDCYKQVKGELTCTAEESEGHAHTEDCYTLACDKEEHTHTGECSVNPNPEVLPEVQAFVEAAAKIPDIDTITEENWEDVKPLTDAAWEAYGKIGYEAWAATRFSNEGEYAGAWDAYQKMFPAKQAVDALEQAAYLKNFPFTGEWTEDEAGPVLTISGEGVYNGYYALVEDGERVRVDGLSTLRGQTGPFRVVFGAGVTGIGERAFEGCTQLASVDLGGVTEIGKYAFHGCTGLTDINLEGVTSIGESAFWKAFSSSAEVAITLNNASVGRLAFSSSNIKTLTANNLTGIGYQAFVQSALAEVTVSVAPGAEVSEAIFIRCPSLKTATVTGDLLAKYAFRECPALETVELNGVTAVGPYAFYKCPKLQTITLPEGLTEIGDFAFRACTALETVVFPGSLRTVGTEAFMGAGLAGDYDLSRVEYIAFNAFTGTKVSSITVSDATVLEYSDVFNAAVNGMAERVTSILAGKFVLEDATAIDTLAPAGWTSEKTGAANGTDYGDTQITKEARWSNSDSTTAEVQIQAYYADNAQMDFVFVLDLSNSMSKVGNPAAGDVDARIYDMQSKLLDVTRELMTTPGYDCRVAFTGFGMTSSLSSGAFFADADAAASYIRNDLKPFYENTNYGLGLEAALELINGNGGRNTCVVFISDGQPYAGNGKPIPDSYYGYTAAAQIKAAGVDIFGVLQSVPADELASAQQVMQTICTEGKYFTATQTSEFSEAVNGAISCGFTTYTLVDVVGSDFELDRNSIRASAGTVETGADAEGNTVITWTITGLPFETHTLTFRENLKPVDGAYPAGTFDTNESDAELRFGDTVVNTVATPQLSRTANVPYVPEVDPDPVADTYVLTVNYVDGNGDIVATAYTVRLPAGAAYSVSSPAVEGYTPDRDVVSGTMPAGNVTVTVVYAADEADIEDENPPLAELPDPGEDTPDADLPRETEEVPVDDEEDITDEDVPLSDVPKTGDHTNRFLVMAAVSGLCLLTLLSGRRKEDEA